MVQLCVCWRQMDRAVQHFFKIIILYLQIMFRCSSQPLVRERVTLATYFRRCPGLTTFLALFSLRPVMHFAGTLARGGKLRCCSSKSIAAEFTTYVPVWYIYGCIRHTETVLRPGWLAGSVFAWNSYVSVSQDAFPAIVADRIVRDCCSLRACRMSPRGSFCQIS